MRTRFPFRKNAAIPLLIAGLVVGGCDDSPTGPAPGGGSLVGLSRGAIFVSATTTAFGVPAAISTTFTVRNGSVEPLSLTLSGGCLAGLRVYADAERTGTPVWDSLRLDRCALELALDRVVAPGDSLQEYFHTNEEEILGDSLPAGRYFVSAMLVGADGTVAELPTGEVELTGAKLVDVTVRRSEEVTVPGTSLRIGLVDVTDDQRCPARDAEGNPIFCVWQGNVNLVVSLSVPDMEPVTVVLKSGFDPETEFSVFRIRFFGLVPERILGTEIDPAEYVATFRVVVP